MEYVLDHASSDEIKEMLSKNIKAIGKDYIKHDADFSDSKKLLESLKQFYPSDEIEKKITDFLSEAPVKETKKSSETGTASPEPEPDTTKEHKGKIVTYNFYEGKGTVKDDDGREYPFELKIIKDDSLQNQIKKIWSTFASAGRTSWLDLSKIRSMLPAFSISESKTVLNSTRSPTSGFS